MTTSTPLLDAVGARPVVLCLGSGGVGKTTSAAAVAIALARSGERVVVLTIDPARRLADALGLAGQVGNDAQPVFDDPDSGGALWATMLDPQATFHQLIEQESADSAQAQRIITNRLFVNLTSSLSGTNEYMAAERLHQLHADPRFDRVVVDTPPAHHAMDFLDSPSRLTRFIDHRLYRSVLAPRRGLARAVSTGTRAALGLLGRLVGAELVQDVAAFFADFEGLDEGFRSRAEAIHNLLGGPDTAYLLVATARADRLTEARWILDNLERRGRAVTGVIVNRLLPIDSPAEPTGVSNRSRPLDEALVTNLEQLQTLARQERQLVEQLRRQAANGDPAHPVPVVEIPEQDTPVSDLDGLEGLSRSFGPRSG
jgi:anion-transporting  ArsA/GET3 family ATPase